MTQSKQATPAARKRPKSGSEPPRGGLSREGIVRVALQQVHEEGLAQLSTRRLGLRLGCEAMSIYHHFPSKAHLLDAMVDHAIASIEFPPEGGPPLERLRAASYAYRAMARRHPALYPLIAVHRLNTPTGVRMIERYLVLIREVLPDAELAARHFRTVGYYLTGTSLDETAGYAMGPSAAEPVSDAYVAEHCPSLIAAAPYFKFEHWERTFALGLEALLDAIERDAKALRRASRR